MYRLQQIRSAGILQHVSMRSGIEGGANVFLSVVRSEHEHANLRAACAELADERDTGAAGERQVGDHESRLKICGSLQGTIYFARLAYDLEIRFKLEERAQSLSQDDVILDEQDARLARFSARLDIG